MGDQVKKENPGDIFGEKYLQTRSIMLSGGIDKESAEKVIKQLLVLEAENDEPIKIFINSLKRC